MLITKESLLRIARETVMQRTHQNDPNRDILSIYLTGSLLRDEPLLGNSTDIDLVFIHTYSPSQRREIVPLNDDIHLDIKHNPRKEYEPGRELRVNPWMGPEMYRAVLLYDPQHFFDFTQAAVRDQYHDPSNAHARACLNAEHARGIWSDLKNSLEETPKFILRYLKTVNHAANVLTAIKDRPLGDRRYLLEFKTCCEEFGLPGLTADLYALLGAAQLEQVNLENLLVDWEKDFSKAGLETSADSRLHPTRLTYYQRAFETLLADGNPGASLWALLQTWSLAAAAQPEKEQSTWKDAMNSLGMLSDGMAAKLERLDAFLEQLEIFLHEMKEENG